ncbi:hypothetical protein [Piscinibacter koreensis]|uniref:Uncharacterized protein n=1 Tax=Piscinibacter koreensis TaxID=2742824 RepID=A0A7Y6NLZ8_9BURK|nr:hypothetical protein [Schlegelella koreensis]NUZ05542.1 hypothetical protein [Schlegelella koreensis]
MLVYGDAVERERAADKLARIGAGVRAARATPAGLARHADWVGAFLEAGELAQGVVDAAFHAAGGHETAAPAGDAAMALLHALAKLVKASWNAPAFEVDAAVVDALLATVEAARAECERRAGDAVVDVKQPEGYAFYALYPESYLEAARELPRGEWRVIGIRSIGTSLGAIVAAALDAPLPLTLRPVGHPFDRQLAPGADALLDALAASGSGQALRYAIVDEGPGLSGSSVAAVVRRVLERGVQPADVHVFASHAHGPGAEATPATRALWEAVSVHVASFERSILGAADPSHRLECGVAGVVGPLTAPLRDVGNGGWRWLSNRAPAVAPVHPWQERRKYLAEAGGVGWLVKFAGVGRRGARNVERAVALAKAGFSPRPIGTCHGFVVERWHQDAEPVDALLALSAARERLVRRIADYLAFRATRLVAPAHAGAMLQQLHEAARYNAGQVLGAEIAPLFEVAPAALEALQARVRRVETDNRMHAWEWLVVDGAVLKTDAVDHHAGHDLVGCQDIAWDVVGAAVELDLSPAEQLCIERRMAELGCPVDRDLADALLPWYLGFQLGAWGMALDATGDAAERQRIDALLARYAERLRARVSSRRR